MARNITTAFKNAITSKVVRPIMAVELDFSDGVLKMWNGYGDLTMTAGGSSKTFTGQGDLLGITGVEESSTLSMSGITLTLAGIKSSLISTALSAGYTNRNGAVYLGLFGATQTTFIVTVQSVSGANKYFIDGVQQDTLSLKEGFTYKFDQSNSSNSSHPLRFSTTSNGSHGGGSEYTTGVTTFGTPGNAGAYTQINVAVGAPTLYYYCTNHSGMGGTANTAISNNVIEDVYTIFKGKMDVLNIQEGHDTTVITLKLESRLVTFEKPANRMYTLEDQQVDFSSDIGFEFIPDLQDKEIIWGKETS